MIKYNVNEEKRVVVAYFDGSRDFWEGALDNMLYKLENPTWDTIRIDNCISTRIINEQTNLQGVAKCHPHDTFDVEKGKQIAKSKLLDKWTAIRKRTLKEDMAEEEKEYKRFMFNAEHKFASLG